MTLSPDTCAAVRQRFRARAILIMISSAALSSCGILLPDNVKGNFVCSAPGGTCAPSTVIDDQAIALIAAAPPQQSASQQAEARRYSRKQVQRLAPAQSDTGYARHRGFARDSDSLAHRDARTLRVVFPAFVDEAGNLHEARVIHAVMDQGGWAQLSEGSLAQTIGDAEAENVAAALAPALPEPAATPAATVHLVQEALGRSVPTPAQPQRDTALTIEAIRAQVAERLRGARTTQRTPAQPTVGGAMPSVAKQPHLRTRSSVPEERAAPTNPPVAANAPAGFAGPEGE